MNNQKLLTISAKKTYSSLLVTYEQSFPPIQEYSTTHPYLFSWGLIFGNIQKPKQSYKELTLEIMLNLVMKKMFTCSKSTIEAQKSVKHAES